MKQYLARFGTLIFAAFGGIEITQGHFGLQTLWFVLAAVSAGFQEHFAVVKYNKERSL